MIRIAICLIFSLFFSAAHAQVGTGFTYQGRLQDGAQPANGLFDFEFRLHDANSGGAQIGTTFTLNDVPVQQGIFSVLLDFGAGVFNGNGRWLAIGVREGVSTGSYDLLSPRQALTAAPYAQYALSGNPGPAGAIGPAGAAGPMGATGSTGPAGAIGPTGAAGPMGETGNRGPAGAIGPAGAAGPMGATGNTGPAGAIGPTGAAGPEGATGPQGASGVVSISTIATFFGPLPPGAAGPGGTAEPFTFIGNFTPITVTAGQRITASGVMSFSIGATVSTYVNLSTAFCYSANTNGAPLTLFTPNYVDTFIERNTGETVAAANSVVLSSAGTYRVGLCARNQSSTETIQGGDVNAWFMVTN